MSSKIIKSISTAAAGRLLTISYVSVKAEETAEASAASVKSGFFVGAEEGYLLIGSIVLLIILFIITFVHMRKFNKSEKLLVEAKAELSDNYVQLEAEYHELMEENGSLEVQLQDVKKERDKAEKLAYMDYLTALPNETSFMRVLDSVMVTLRNGEIIAVLMVEISNFNEITETMGYKCGDELLIDAAHRLMQALDENDSLAKSSGSRFLILTQNIENTSGFEDKLKKIQKVFSYPVVLSTSECFVNISIGITLCPKDGKSSQTLIKNAETAVFEASLKGKNQYLYFNDSMNEKRMEKLQMQADLRNAVANGELEAYYQPLVDLKEKKIVAAEALVRWEHPDKGVLLPGDFLPSAEQNGQIIEIGRFILTAVCEDWRDYVGKHPEFRISVNISARQLKDENFTAMVEEIVGKEEFPASCLQFDIAEQSTAESRERAIDVMLELKEIGVTFCFDDFGRASSSLNQLLKAPFDALKVDNILLDSVFENNYSGDVVTNLVGLAHSLRLQVIAEKVEFMEQEELLINAGFDRAQGYLYGHPLPFDDISQFLQ